MTEKVLTPHFWQHGPVCERKSCKLAALDALNSAIDAHEQTKPLAAAIASRYETGQHAAIGWRQDSFAEIGFENDWWATEVAKSV